MKKLLAALLASAMAFSMSSVAFAAKNETHDGVVAVDPTMFRYEQAGIGDPSTPLYIPPHGMASMTVGFGEVAHYALLTQDSEGDYALISDRDMVDGLRVKANYEQGEEHVASVSVVKKKIDQLGVSPVPGHHGNWSSPAYEAFLKQGPGYYYFIAMQTIPRVSTTDVDITGTFTLNKSKKGDDENKNYKVKDLEADFTANIFYPYNYQAFGTDFYGDLEITSDTVAGTLLALEPDDHYLLKYDYDDEVEFSFGLEPNEGTFTVDVSGQGKNLLNYNTAADEALCAANPDAAVWFLNFNGVRFNRTGEFLYEADGLNYAYQIMADGSLKLLGEFEDGEVSFKTRTLGRYAFSDIELTAASAQA